MLKSRLNNMLGRLFLSPTVCSRTLLRLLFLHILVVCNVNALCVWLLRLHTFAGRICTRGAAFYGGGLCEASMKFKKKAKFGKYIAMCHATGGAGC